MSQLTLPYFPVRQEETDRLFNWIFETIDPYLKGRILEINSSQGQMSSLLVNTGYSIQLNATSEAHRDFLKEKFKDQEMVRGVHKISFLNTSMELKYRKFQGQFPTVLAIGDFSGHISFDKRILGKAMRFLEPEGHLIVADKSSVELFPGSDLDLPEIKRYHRSTLTNLLGNCTLTKVDYFNYDGLGYVAIGKKSW